MTGERTPTRERLHALLDELTPAAARLGCETELRHARTLVTSNGADRQREAYASGGMRGLTEFLVAGFEQPKTGAGGTLTVLRSTHRRHFQSRAAS